MRVVKSIVWRRPIGRGFKCRQIPYPCRSVVILRTRTMSQQAPGADQPAAPLADAAAAVSSSATMAGFGSAQIDFRRDYGERLQKSYQDFVSELTQLAQTCRTSAPGCEPVSSSLCCAALFFLFFLFFTVEQGHSLYPWTRSSDAG
jgi:hypothetical protein